MIRRWHYRLSWMLWSLVLASFMAIGSSAPRVLLLNSYHPQFEWTQELTRGVQLALTSSIPMENLHIEFMDKRRFVDDEIYEARLIALLQHKYRQYSPDIIITSDDYAYYFMLAHGEVLFPGKPIVFCGVNVFESESLKDRSNITGILEGMEIQGNLALIKTLQPEVQRIIMLGDTTGLGLRMTKVAREIKTNWLANPELANGVSLDIWDKFTLEDLNHSVAQLPEDTALLMLAIHKDSQGQYFSFDAELPSLSQASKVPIYGMWGALMIGKGVIGGLMNDPFEHGYSAAKMAIEVLNGTPIAQLPIQDKTVFTPHFDYAQLTRFSIDLSLLPQNSKIIGQPKSLYQEYTDVINGVIALVLFLIIVITVLLTNIRKRIAIQAQLDKLNRELEAQVHARTQDLDSRNRQLQEASASMKLLAFTDTLTGLANRRAAKDEIAAYITRFQQGQLNFSAAILDIDHFKQLNDTYGHSCGDEVLTAFSAVLLTALRPGDRVYRWGGEEFLIILPEADIHRGLQICERLCHSLASHSFSKVERVTASIGVTDLCVDDNLDSLVARADIALYRAKDMGRNRACAN
jgi:diguanylate cyclase (GGDEF)-like protein